jgi:chromate transporter
MAVVVTAVLKIGKKALKNHVMLLLAAASFVCIFFLKVPFPIIVLGASLIGLIGSIALPNFFRVDQEKRIDDYEKGYVQICEDPDYCHIHPSKRMNVLLILTFIGLWTFPLLILYVRLTEYKEELSRGLQRVQQRITQLKNE